MVLTKVNANGGKRLIPAENDTFPPALYMVPRRGWPNSEVAGAFGSRNGGGRCPAGRVGIDGSVLGSFSSRPRP